MNRCIPIAEPDFTQKENRYVTDAMKSGWVSSLGEYLTKFEQGFAKYMGSKYALTTTNGTAALHLALVSLGIENVHEVIIPDLTFIATANAITFTGAKPVFVDIDPETWCIDPASIAKAITSKTKAIIPVHLYGHPADMDCIMEIAKEHDLYVIEDAAEAHGAEYKNRKVGNIGNIGIFSFYGNKIITSGEGGMLITNSEETYERAKLLRDHAMSKEKRYWHTKIGYNYRMTNIQAALGSAQLERIDELIEKKRQIFFWYKECLKDFKGIRLNPEKKWAKNVYWMICLVMEKRFKISRDEMMLRLKERWIDTRPFFYPPSQMPMYYNGNANPVAIDISQRGLNLPSGVPLKREQVIYICQQVRKILGLKTY